MLSEGQTLISRYRIIRHICSGGMGAVYEAFDSNLNARVAIKENFFEEESLRVAFHREAQLLANLRHQFLPHCSNFFSFESRQYLVMEFIEGDDLAAILSKNRMALKTEVVLGWARQLLDVLNYLHGEAIIHRDIKPSNIKVVDGRVYLLDFGLAYGQSGEMDTIAGSDLNWHCYSKYSSLEQLRCERTCPASDLYSLAATLYKLLTTVQPIDAQSRSEMLACGKRDPLKDIRFYKSDLDKNVRRTIMQCLSLDPHERPQSAREMGQMMFPEKPLQPASAVPRKFVRRKVLAGILILCVLLGLLIPTLARRESMRANTVPETPKVFDSIVMADQYADEAKQLTQSGKYEEAAEKLREALSLATDNAYLHFVYGDLLWDIKDEMAESAANMPEVQEQADIILRLVQSPNSEREFLARSWASLAKGDLDSALADANEALRFNPDSGQGSMLRGTIRYEQAMMNSNESLQSLAGEIMSDYDRAIDQMRDYPQAYINRARIRTELGDFDLAIIDIEQAIKLQPRAGYYYELGYAHYKAGFLEKARNNYQKAIENNQNHYRAHCGLADIHFKKGDWKHAVAEYLLANKVHKSVYAFGQIGWAYNYLGRFEEAKKNFETALHYNQYDLTSQHGLACAYAGLKLFKSALNSYNNALAYAPKDDLNLLAGLHRERAEVYRQLGQEELAEEDEKQVENLEK